MSPPTPSCSKACQRNAPACPPTAMARAWGGMVRGTCRVCTGKRPPPWSDPNLLSLAHQIQSRLFFAHVRASTGTATSVANCHPFTFKKWMFMHNGQIGGYEKVRRRLDAMIGDDVYGVRVGTTDSEAFFYLLFGHGLETDPVGALARTIGTVLKTMSEAKLDEPFRMTAALTDGETLYALRYATDPEPPSLHFSRSDVQMMVVSEPLDAEEGWNAVENAHILVSKPGVNPVVTSFNPN